MTTKGREDLDFKVRVKDGSFKWGENKEYLVVPERAGRRRGLASYHYQEGNAEPIDPYGGSVIVTPEDLNEVGGNRYVQQVFSAIKNQLATNLQWVLIAVVALATIIQFWYVGEVRDDVSALAYQLGQAHPPPPQPATGR